MTKPQDKEAEAQELREREVLRRMLHTPPKPHENKPVPVKTQKPTRRKG
jgi:hypothetical protein